MSEDKYTPDLEEFLEKYPNAEGRYNLADPKVRTKLWDHPGTMNLQSFKRNDARSQEIQALGGKGKAEMINKRKDIKMEKDFILGLIREELNDDEKNRIKPRSIIEMHMKACLASGDLDTASDLALKLLEFDEPKLARVEQDTKITAMGDASTKDMQEFLDNVITYEEFQRRAKGD